MFSQGINTLEEVNMDGFEVVHSNMFLSFPKKTQPICSLWPDKLSFNSMTLKTLHGCEYIRLEVSARQRSILITPVNSSDKDCIRWVRGDRQLVLRELYSKTFAENLYHMFHLDSQQNYRARGRLVSSGSKVMLLFDFKEAEVWRSRDK